MEIGGTSAGVISFTLYDEVVPRTAKVSSTIISRFFGAIHLQ